MKLFLVPLSISRSKLKLFLDNKKVADFQWNTPVEISIKKNKKYIVNIKEGKFKNHFFELDINKDTLLYLKKRFDVFGTRLMISEDKKFRTLINWKSENIL